MTPQQAAEAAEALHFAAVHRESRRLFSAAIRVSIGLQEAGWIAVNLATEDEPKWAWQLARYVDIDGFPPTAAVDAATGLVTWPADPSHLGAPNAGTVT
jgi:hypothetical protein